MMDSRNGSEIRFTGFPGIDDRTTTRMIFGPVETFNSKTKIAREDMQLNLGLPASVSGHAGRILICCLQGNACTVTLVGNPGCSC